MHDWSKIIQTILDDTGWSQTLLAEKLGVPVTTISRLLHVQGQTPRYDTGDKLMGMHRLTSGYGVKLQASA